MENKIKTIKDVKKLVDLSLYAGQILIANGAEIYRAEDTARRICESYENLESINIYALPSAILVAVEYEGESYMKFRRVDLLRMNIEKIDLVNDFSRRFCYVKNMEFEEAFNELESIDKKPDMDPWKIMFSGAMAGAFFTLLFGGQIEDFICTYIIVAFMTWILIRISVFKFTFVLENFIGAFIVSILAVVSVKIGIGSNVDKIVIGGIMTLVPGIAATNASRDIMNGDFQSGVIGYTKSVFLALSIALGVGVILKIFM